MSNKLSIRLAQEKDFPDVLKAANEGIYGERDYFPFVFHQWLKTPAKYMFVAELNGKVIGFEAATVIDSGQTIYCHTLRINQEYRGRRYSYQIHEEVLRQVNGIVGKEATRVRFVTHKSNVQIQRFSQRLGYHVFMKKRLNRFEIPKGKVTELKNLYGARNEVYKLNVIDAIKFVLDLRKFDHVITNQTLEVLKEPYELLPANADLVFKEGDETLTDLSAEQLKQGIPPRSFSHGRYIQRIGIQSWVCSIYTNERDVFKEHLIQHLMAAVEQLEKTGRKTCLEVVRLPALDFDEQEVFKEVLGSEEGFTDFIFCHEKSIQFN